ncbi:MAG: site-specific integrase [bacterium]
MLRVRPFRGGWECDIHVRFPDGRKIRERRVPPVKSRTAALRWGQMLEQELLRKNGLAFAAAPTLREFAARFLDHCRSERHKHSGVARKDSALRVYLLPLLGRRRLSEISAEDIARVKLRLREHAPSTVNNTLTTLSSLLHLALEWNLIDRMPCTIRMLSRPRTEAGYWDFDELDRLERAAAKVGPNAEMIVALGALAGLRLGEMIALRWTDVDLPRTRITVRQNDWRGHVDTPKGGRSGIVDLCDRLATALVAHQSRSRLLSQDGRVLCREDGRSLTEKIVRVYIEQTERLAGLPPRGVHALRHTFGAHLAMRGASPKAIQELMRHADLSMTQRYTHLSPAARESAVRLLDQPAHAASDPAAGRP